MGSNVVRDKIAEVSAFQFRIASVFYLLLCLLILVKLSFDNFLLTARGKDVFQLGWSFHLNWLHRIILINRHHQLEILLSGD